MMPHHWASIAGTAMRAKAKLGTTAGRKVRTEMYIKEVNKKLFHPRGLKVSIASTDAMMAVLQILASEPMIAPLGPETMDMSSSQRVLGSYQCAGTDEADNHAGEVECETGGSVGQRRTTRRL